MRCLSSVTDDEEECILSGDNIKLNLTGLARQLYLMLLLTTEPCEWLTSNNLLVL